MENKWIEWPVGIQQWIRIIVAISGILLGIICMDDLNALGTGATLIGFIGYLFDSLFTNMEERKKWKSMKRRIRWK